MVAMEIERGGGGGWHGSSGGSDAVLHQGMCVKDH